MAIRTGSGIWTAVIGDMVHSRALSAQKRAAAQREFTKLVTLLNRRFRAHVASRFIITLGDEFQGLLSNAEVIPELVWTIESEYRRRDVRLGFGFGKLHTPMRPVALNIDGPVLHNARSAITVARSRKLLGGVFEGFGSYDTVLTGYAQIMRHVRQRMTERQHAIVEMLRAGHTQLEVAEKLDITKQAVSDHAIAAGSEAYRVAELGWKTALYLATLGERRRKALSFSCGRM
ncbi:MAG TPA: SatD family protein [Thermoanaerobaculia bacterium]|nr:SatD family protein [Thermoanaerobaculia bacterium]